MKKTILIFVTLLSTLIANFIPPKTYTSVSAVSGNTITMANSFAKNGMSGLVLRQINGVDYALAYVKQTAKNRAVVIDTDPLGGKNLANIKPQIKVGDRVIGGFLYDKVMVLAPNRDTFVNIQNRFGIKSINPDLFMSFLANKGSNNPNKSDYKEFAKLTHVGLFVIFKNGFITLYDPISDSEISKVMMDISTYNAVKPFYNTFK